MTVDLYPAHTFTLRVFMAVRKELAKHKQRDVAAVMGVTEARISTILSGGQNLTVETVARLLSAAEKLNENVKPGMVARCPKCTRMHVCTADGNCPILDAPR